MIQPRTLILAIATSLALGVTAGPALAQPADPPPSAADIEAAKKAFGEGKAAFDAKKFGEAVEKFKESYRLSKRPTLLYNIALALDENKQPDMALFYYKKFMADAPTDDAQRPLADARIKALSPAPVNATPAPGTGTPTTGTGTPAPADPVKPKPRTAGPIVVAPAGTYSANDFQHRIVDEAPPGKSLDVTATVPTDSGFAVTLFYRGAGEANFTALPMKWRYNELVGRIPGAKMTGTSVQYYLEVKDQAGTMITKVAKPASPNLIYMEANAKSNLYPDWDYDTAKLTAVPESGKVVDDTTPTTTTTTSTDDNPLANDTSDDPLAAGGNDRVAEVEPTTPEIITPGGRDDHGGGGGFMDVGSTKFNVVKWGATGVAVAAFVGAGIFYRSATNSATTLEEEADAADCFGGEAPPCVYDEYLQDTESSGKLNEKLFYVSLGVGAVIGGVAIYYWIKDLKGSAVREAPTTTGRGKKKKSRTFIAAPAIGDGVLGGTAAWEW